ncbi:short-chain dehydrogenase/reductase-like protein [Phyllosticta citrichinensis]|uniref:Short-chain dehydrogenase/reductase-like protein n=1 Tax=Phyllosticta citrichinensis TaxID=1130410 RepID=A0ABR1XT92_9PEZI
MPPLSQPWALVSPASRGIGRALARHVLRTTRAPVVATARGDLERAQDEILEGLESDARERLSMVELNYLDEKTIEAASKSCAERFPPRSHHLHLALVVPGLLFPEKAPAQIDADNALLTLQTNTLGPLLAIKHFARHMPRKSTSMPTSDDGSAADAYANLPSPATWATMSARVGSISDNRLGGWYSYRASKAAVNQITKTFDNHLRTQAGDKAVAVAMHPGTVRTGLSRDFWDSVAKEKLFEADWVAERLVGVLKDGKGERLRGKCWDWKGEEVPP